jgi:hypothetical protein
VQDDTVANYSELICDAIFAANEQTRRWSGARADIFSGGTEFVARYAICHALVEADPFHIVKDIVFKLAPCQVRNLFQGGQIKAVSKNTRPIDFVLLDSRGTPFQIVSYRNYLDPGLIRGDLKWLGDGVLAGYVAGARRSFLTSASQSFAFGAGSGLSEMGLSERYTDLYAEDSVSGLATTSWKDQAYCFRVERARR